MLGGRGGSILGGKSSWGGMRGEGVAEKECRSWGSGVMGRDRWGGMKEKGVKKLGGGSRGGVGGRSGWGGMRGEGVAEIKGTASRVHCVGNLARVE